LSYFGYFHIIQQCNFTDRPEKLFGISLILAKTLCGGAAMEVPLISGRDYPNTYRSFVEMFPDNASCAAYLIKLRWPNGFICPACKITTTPSQGSRGRLTRPLCRHRTYPQAGTIFDKTRTPLTTWFEAAWHVSTAKNGLSAKTLERTLGTNIGLPGPCSSAFVWLW
jgi:hypothetical protein